MICSPVIPIVQARSPQFSLPDIACLIAPRKAIFVNPVDGNSEPASNNLRKNIYRITEPYYREHENNFKIIDMNDSDSLNTLLSNGFR